MDRFTWFMTLIMAALDAALDSRTLRKVLLQFLLKLFEESPSGSDFLEHELIVHLQGWQSAACVRGISLAARRSWTRLAEEGSHPVGYIPNNASDDLIRFLIWLTSEQGNNCFWTASSDIFSLAKLLGEIGICLSTSTAQAPARENETQVIFHSHISPSSHPSSLPRHGIRFPVQQPEKSLLMWPFDDVKTSAQMQKSFLHAQRIVKEGNHELRIRPTLTEDLYYCFKAEDIVVYCSTSRNESQTRTPLTAECVSVAALLPIEINEQDLVLWALWHELEMVNDITPSGHPTGAL